MNDIRKANNALSDVDDIILVKGERIQKIIVIDNNSKIE